MWSGLKHAYIKLFSARIKVLHGSWALLHYCQQYPSLQFVQVLHHLKTHSPIEFYMHNITFVPSTRTLQVLEMLAQSTCTLFDCSFVVAFLLLCTFKVAPSVTQSSLISPARPCRFLSLGPPYK